jgi:hypothetical protein
MLKLHAILKDAMKIALVKTLLCACALVVSSLSASAQTAGGESACRADFMKFCSHASGKSNDMLACVMANQSRYSDVCKKELQARAAAGNGLMATGKVGSPLQ